MKLSNRKRTETIEDLQNLSRRINNVADRLLSEKKLDDIFDEDIQLIRNIEEAYSTLAKKILSNQKANGKEFLSDLEIDDLVSKIIAENKQNKN